MDGSREFTAWQWTVRAAAANDDDRHGLKAGEKIGVARCRLVWWELEHGGLEEKCFGSVRKIVRYLKTDKVA